MPLWLQLTLTFALSLAAAFAGSYSGRAFASSRLAKRVTELETEVATLTSEYSKVLALAKKISQRVALDQHRDRPPRDTSATLGNPPPPGDKAAAKRFYLTGKTHQDVARRAMGAGE